ncbi:basic amino acid ABC transporter substrate-binding protein [Rubrobacter taiwanensis]|uniref:Basic amino acid ABC transporter substrate-binding protein n=1 Tax=Rubrobacter taiwanensis TaxID=185139 RepID=A0A4R1BQ12_9ACTN|nr:basic amino acid ABC transporter substrate-binding protein [Rubrobacter taiwanensis]TCJ19813.1 basic amino acid ABC transporter substrate-binding protein [Rubrobacter taiwanensis]
MGRFRALLLVAVCAFALAACGGGGDAGGENGAEQPEDGAGLEGRTVTIASDIAYRPFEFMEGGEPVGFDIDLINEIAERAGFEPDIQNVTFDGIIPGLQSGTYDMAISAMTITEEREQQVDFSDPYFNADQSLLVRAGSDIESVDDLADANVGVQLGTTGAMLATEFQSEGRIGELTTFDTIEDAFLALENGQVDAVINDFPVSADRVETSGADLEIVETFPTGEQYGIAFPPDSELREPVNQALAEIKEDGTYAEIYEKWFGQEPEEIP